MTDLTTEARRIAAGVTVVPCPRCHEQCGWCSDYRYMHGKLPMPGSRRKCTIPGMTPEGDQCPMCGGAMKVARTVTYERIKA